MLNYYLRKQKIYIGYLQYNHKEALLCNCNIHTKHTLSNNYTTFNNRHFLFYTICYKIKSKQFNSIMTYIKQQLISLLTYEKGIMKKIIIYIEYFYI